MTKAMKKEKAVAMVMASFAGDSLALGAHWIYETEIIEQKFGRVEHLLKPLKESYHPTKDKGEFTHYGDQTLVLLESLADRSEFDLHHFSESWQALFKNYHGYFDEATKATLVNFASGKGPAESGSFSLDLGGAARIAPLVYRYREDLEKLVSSVKTQTAMTHNTPLVIGSAEFFGRVAWKVLHWRSPVAAMREVREESFEGTPFAKMLEVGLESKGTGTRDAIMHFGQSCDSNGAFPSVVHLLSRYENDLREALIENVMAGGDSAARGAVVGMILGAHLGKEAIPREWISDLKQAQHIVDLLEKIGQAER